MPLFNPQPAGTTSAAGILQLDGTASDITPNGLQAAGATGKAPDAAHVHKLISWPSVYYLPAGATAETVPRTTGTVASNTPTSGQLRVHMIGLPKGLAVNNITFMTGNNAKTGGTHGWYVLLDNTLVVRAVSADQTDASTVWGSGNTSYTLSVAASAYTTTYDGYYYLGVCVAQSGGTMPNFCATSFMQNPLGQIAPIPGGISSTGQSTPPTAGTTMGAVSSDGQVYYGYTS